MSAHWGLSIGYFRVYGYGLHWQNLQKHRPLWSDREHIYRRVRIGRWQFTPLKRGARGFRR